MTKYSWFVEKEATAKESPASEWFGLLFLVNEAQNGWGWKEPLEMIWFNLAAQAGSQEHVQAGCPGTCKTQV